MIVDFRIIDLFECIKNIALFILLNIIIKYIFKSSISLNYKNNNKPNFQTFKKNINFNNYNYKSIFIFIIELLFIIPILTFNNPLNIKINDSKIILKIKGSGYKNVICPHSNFNSKYYPDTIYINGEEKNVVVGSLYNLGNDDENIIELVWRKDIVYLGYIFCHLAHISEINFYYADTSKVTDMTLMLYGCSSLTSINLTNFDTSNVISMDGMFSRCSSLTSLDLSNFNTINVRDMNCMFSSCQLSSLDLSNFNTFNLENTLYMFFECNFLP